MLPEAQAGGVQAMVPSGQLAAADSGNLAIIQGGGPIFQIGPARNGFVYRATTMIVNGDPVCVCQRNMDTPGCVANAPDSTFYLYLWRMKNGHWLAAEKPPGSSWHAVKPAFMTSSPQVSWEYLANMQGGLSNVEWYQFGHRASMAFKHTIITQGDTKWQMTPRVPAVDRSPDGNEYEPIAISLDEFLRLGCIKNAQTSQRRRLH